MKFLAAPFLLAAVSVGNLDNVGIANAAHATSRTPAGRRAARITNNNIFNYYPRRAPAAPANEGVAAAANEGAAAAAADPANQGGGGVAAAAANEGAAAAAADPANQGGGGVAAAAANQGGGGAAAAANQGGVDVAAAAANEGDAAGNPRIRVADDAGLEERDVGVRQVRPRGMQQFLPRGADPLPPQDEQEVNENSFWRLYQDSAFGDLPDRWRLWYERGYNVLVGLFQDADIQPTIAELQHFASHFSRHFHLIDCHCPTIGDLEVYFQIHFRPWERYVAGQRHLAVDPSTRTFTERCLSYPVQIFARTAQFLYNFAYDVALVGAHTTIGFGNAVPLDGPWDQNSSGADNASARALYRQIRDATAPLQRQVVRFLSDRSPNLRHAVILGEAAFAMYSSSDRSWLGRLLPAFRIAQREFLWHPMTWWLRLILPEPRMAVIVRFSGILSQLTGLDYVDPRGQTEDFLRQILWSRNPSRNPARAPARAPNQDPQQLANDVLDILGNFGDILANGIQATLWSDGVPEQLAEYLSTITCGQQIGALRQRITCAFRHSLQNYFGLWMCRKMSCRGQCTLGVYGGNCRICGEEMLHLMPDGRCVAFLACCDTPTCNGFTLLNSQCKKCLRLCQLTSPPDERARDSQTIYVDVHVDGSFDHSCLTAGEAQAEMVAECNEIRRYSPTAPLFDCPYLCTWGRPTNPLYSTAGRSGKSPFWTHAVQRLKNNGSNDGEIVIGNTRFVFTRAGIF